MSGSEHINADCKNGSQPLAAHVVGITMSAGGLRPLQTILSGLPAAFPASVIVVQHVAGLSELPRILGPKAALCVKFAEAGEPLRCGVAYVCPPKHHVVVNPDATIALSSAPRIRFQRPSADWFFRSLAASFQDRAIGVVLSGRLDDGARGITYLKRSGGHVIVQDPSTCQYPSMPVAAINTGCVSSVLQPAHVASALIDVLHASDAASVRFWEEPFSTS